ncbi:DUF6338 family protein [Clostridium perfringens]|uniref:DUF6338 family protein n=1 Tax=Clostridium perfringens TaxID=1502 RepID=UPI0013E2BFE9|nr:DUF6338 family protein [Clostridium perfringens]EIF2086668.1 hypothetical protein [Clostridium perfringens]MDK0830159.1 DUF6338 family protein [Clostridium perfringens]NGT03818.1 hypothetical protein [Clostridium perfringens]
MGDIQKILDNIPYLFLYFIPGYITISIKESIKHEKTSKDRHIIIMSIVVSFVIRALLQGTFDIINWVTKSTYIVDKDTNPIVLLVISVLFGIIWSIYCGSSLEKKINRFLGNDVVSSSNVWNYAMKSMNGSWVRIYLKEENIIYIGKLINYTIDPEDNNREILLRSYTSYSFDKREVLEDFDDDNKMVFIKCDSIKNIEIFKDSSVDVNENKVENELKCILENLVSKMKILKIHY